MKEEGGRTINEDKVIDQNQKGGKDGERKTSMKSKISF